MPRPMMTCCGPGPDAVANERPHGFLHTDNSNGTYTRIQLQLQKEFVGLREALVSDILAVLQNIRWQESVVQQLTGQIRPNVSVCEAPTAPGALASPWAPQPREVRPPSPPPSSIDFDHIFEPVRPDDPVCPEVLDARRPLALRKFVDEEVFSNHRSASSEVKKANQPPAIEQREKKCVQESVSHGSSSYKEEDRGKPLRPELKKNTGFVNAPKDNRPLDEEAYNVENFYHETGRAQAIARNEHFAHVTMAVISLNAVYIGVDADNNPADTVNASFWPFQICEHFFCAFFTFEITVRLFSFKHKRDCLRDYWFTFDSILVCFMVAETWLLSFFILCAGGGGLPVPTAPMKLLRLARLARLVRLMRTLPELVIMVKGLMAAVRGVGCSLLMIAALLYIFAIVLHMFLKDEEEMKEQFGRVAQCMWTLLMDGTFMDNTGDTLNNLRDLNQWGMVCVFMIYVLLSSLTVMNMLIGVLCEVVRAVGEAEKENAAIDLVKHTVLLMLKRLDEDGSGEMSREELQQVLVDPQARQVLDELKVDVPYFVELMDMFFVNDNSALNIEQIMHMILDLRGDRIVTVKDIIDVNTFNRWVIMAGLKRHELKISGPMEQPSRNGCA